VNRIANAWRLAKGSWQLLARDRELMLVPIVAGALALVAFAVVAAPGALLLGGDDAGGATDWAGRLILVLASVVATWVSVMGQAAVMSGAAQRMDGGDPTLGTAVAGARHHTTALLGWAALATVVAVVLDTIRERFGMLGRIVGSFGNLAFGVLSFLALPIIVFEGVGAIEAFKRSSRLLKGTWGEQVSFSFGMGLLGFVAALPGILVAVGLLATGIVALQVVGIVVGVAWVLAVAAVTSALSAVFKVALYRYARNEPVAAEFAPSDLAGAFRPRGR
jgi:hypothetical protein